HAVLGRLQWRRRCDVEPDGPLSRRIRARRDARRRPARYQADEGDSVLSAARTRRAHGRRLVPVSRCDRSVRSLEEVRMKTKRTLGLGCVLLGAFGFTTAADAAEQITFVSQGGAYQEAQSVAILDPSAKKLGITIHQDSIPDAWPAIKTQVGSGKPIWDVV